MAAPSQDLSPLAVFVFVGVCFCILAVAVHIAFLAPGLLALLIGLIAVGKHYGQVG